MTEPVPMRGRPVENTRVNMNMTNENHMNKTNGPAAEMAAAGGENDGKRDDSQWAGQLGTCPCAGTVEDRSRAAKTAVGD